MLEKISKEDLYLSKFDWLKSRFHFSFAQYMNRNNMNFGVLRVLNDDEVLPQSGFDTHPHKDMEIVTYVIDGELTHKDSMGNEETLYRGEVQYMSAGKGVFHSEYNLHKSKKLYFLQIWILPFKRDLQANYGSFRFKKEQRNNQLLNIVSSKEGNANIKLNQDVNFYVSETTKDKIIDFELKENRQIYFVLIEGKVEINEIILNSKDALKVVDEKSLCIKSLENSHFLFIEMKKEV